MRSNVLAITSALLASAGAHAAVIGPGSGNPELLMTQGNKAYNAGQFEKAHDAYLQAARANPALPAPYLSLARAYLRSGHRALSCYTYRLYLKVSPDTGERAKAQNELDLCEKQLQANPESEEPGPKFAGLKAAVLQAIDRGAVLGSPDAEKETLTVLLAAEYVGPDLVDIAGKIKGQAEAQGQAAFAAANKPDAKPEALRTGAEMYRFAADVGAEEASAHARAFYLEGSASLLEGKFDPALEAFRKSVAASPTPEARFRQGVALWNKGDHAAAVKMLERDMKDDPRTALLALSHSMAAPDGRGGAGALEEFLFVERYKK